MGCPSSAFGTPTYRRPPWESAATTISGTKAGEPAGSTSGLRTCSSTSLPCGMVVVNRIARVRWCSSRASVSVEAGTLDSTSNGPGQVGGRRSRRTSSRLGWRRAGAKRDPPRAAFAQEAGERVAAHLGSAWVRRQCGQRVPPFHPSDKRQSAERAIEWAAVRGAGLEFFGGRKPLQLHFHVVIAIELHLLRDGRRQDDGHDAAIRRACWRRSACVPRYRESIIAVRCVSEKHVDAIVGVSRPARGNLSIGFGERDLIDGKLRRHGEPKLESAGIAGRDVGLIDDARGLQAGRHMQHLANDGCRFARADCERPNPVGIEIGQHDLRRDGFGSASPFRQKLLGRRGRRRIIDDRAFERWIGRNGEPALRRGDGGERNRRQADVAGRRRIVQFPANRYFLAIDILGR